MSTQALYLPPVAKISRALNRKGHIRNRGGYHPPGSIPYADSLPPLEANNLNKYWPVFQQRVNPNFVANITRLSVQRDGSAFVNTVDKRLYYLPNVTPLSPGSSTTSSSVSVNLLLTPPMSPPPRSPNFLVSQDRCVPIHIVEFNGVDARSILVADNFFAVLSSTNEMFYICSNVYNYIKYRSANPVGNMHTLYKLDMPDIFQLMLCDGRQYILNKDDDVYELTFNPSTGRVYAYHFNELKKVAKIVCGSKHALALRFDGKLFGWLSNKEGQLGLRGVSHSDQPVELFPDCKFFDVAASREHTLLACANGEVWELGVRRGLKMDTDLKVVPIKHSVSGANLAIKAVMDHSRYSMAQTYDGTIYVWGHLTPFGFSRNEARPLPGVYRHLVDAYGQFAKNLATEANGLMLTLWYDRKFKPCDEAFQVNDQKTCDVTFKFAANLLGAHRRIIRARSPMIDNILTQSWRYHNHKFMVDDFDYACFARYVCYLYDGYVHNIDDLSVLPLLLFADRFAEKELFDDCIHYIETKLSGVGSYVCALYELADRHKLVALERRLRLYIVCNLNKFLCTSAWNLLDGKLKHFLLRHAN